jgi:hypothetical protein
MGGFFGIGWTAACWVYTAELIIIFVIIKYIVFLRLKPEGKLDLRSYDLMSISGSSICSHVALCIRPFSKPHFLSFSLN